MKQIVAVCFFDRVLILILILERGEKALKNDDRDNDRMTQDDDDLSSLIIVFSMPKYAMRVVSTNVDGLAIYFCLIVSVRYTKLSSSFFTINTQHRMMRKNEGRSDVNSFTLFL